MLQLKKCIVDVRLENCFDMGYFIWYSTFKSPSDSDFIVLVKQAVIFLSKGVKKYLISPFGDMCAAVPKFVVFMWTAQPLRT